MDSKRLLTLVVALLVISTLTCSRNLFYFSSSLPQDRTRYWIGPEYWSNRLQDWRINDGRMECLAGKMPLRTVHLLTRSLGPSTGDLKMSVRTGPIGEVGRGSFSGFLVGAGSPDLDYRSRALVHHGSGKNGGLVAGVNGAGSVVFYDNEVGLQPLTMTSSTGEGVPPDSNEDLLISLFLRPERDSYSVTLSVRDSTSGRLFQEGTVSEVDAARLTGNVALVAHGEVSNPGPSYWFRDWEVFGSKVTIHEDRVFGPVLSALHTMSRGTLKMTAQLPPIAESDHQKVRLDLAELGSNHWWEAGEAELDVPGWTATFRIPDWETERDFRYRLAYPLTDRTGKLQEFFYEGVIRHDPVEKDEIVVAAFTGNSNTLGSFSENYSFTRNRIWFPHEDLVEHVSLLEPDFLVYTGDQVYEGRPTEPDRSGGLGSYLDYLYKWYLWCWAHRDLTCSIPAVCLPDDHDVYHGNIWGAGGRKARDEPLDGVYPEYYRGLESHWRQDGGGYLLPPGFVNMVQRTQTSHLPDPPDPAPVEQGIEVYFCEVNYGGLSFAVIEDRKFKSSPSVMVPDGKVVNGFSQVEDFDPRKADVPGAELLGKRQLSFLREWAADWQGAWMKVALSQTIFANLSTYPEGFKTDAGTPRLEPLPPGVIPKGYKLAMDMDSNGWPQTARNKALHELRRGYAFMIGGDQHLGSIVHHGIDDWEDAGFSLCVPSVANLWPRRWFPPEPGLNHKEGMPPYTGQYFDGFGNRITVWAVSNPYRSGWEPAELHDRAPGYGIARFAKKAQTITMECWPRFVDPTSPEAEQYPGWPMTVSVEDNYGRNAKAYLPTLEFDGIEDPVVQVIAESDGQIVYTLRVTDRSFRPKVFRPGTYTIYVGEPGTERMKTLRGIRAVGDGGASPIALEFQEVQSSS